MANKKAVRIGACSGFWGDSPEGARQLVQYGEIDFLIGDYLAEITMGLLSRMRLKKPELGFTGDFVDPVMKELLPALAQKGIKVVSNAGGMNPKGCAQAVEALVKEYGLNLKVAYVVGDDLLPIREQLPALKDMATGQVLTPKAWSINAYLGAQGIVKALESGADIVITGRCVDSAVAIAPMIYWHGWSFEDWHKLSQASLAGHLIECGCQVTGGLFTDWETVPGWDNMGFPIVDVEDSGDFELYKPPGTGGLITPQTASEQLVYEIGNPAQYFLPDVVCDWTHVQIQQVSDNRIRVTGAKGSPAPASYKVCSTYQDGFRVMGTLMIGGRDAVAKAKRMGESILSKSERLIKAKGMAGFTETSVEVIGSESTYGPHAKMQASREVILKVAAIHTDKAALDIMAQEFAPTATSMAQGITGFFGGRPSPAPRIRVHSSLLDKKLVPIHVVTGDQEKLLEVFIPSNPTGLSLTIGATYGAKSMIAPIVERYMMVPLIALAYGRSGDKGDIMNVGIMARDKEYLPYIYEQVTAEKVAQYFAHSCQGKVIRYELPGIMGFNFMLEDALGGGGLASIRYDPQGKAGAQMLLDMPIKVPASWAEKLRAYL